MTALAEPDPLALPTEQDLRRLARFRSREGVLSAYLSFDPSAGERRDVHAVALELLHALGGTTRSPSQEGRLAEERERLLDFLAQEFELHGRSVIVFSCLGRELWRVYQLQVPVRPMARFAERPAVAQLAAVLDEHERYAVALVDKDQARLLDIYLGRVEHQIDIADKYPGRTEMGGWAQARYARHRDAHLHAHLLHVVEALLTELRRRPFDRLIAGGPDEARSAFLHLLPRGLRGRLAGEFACELFASDADILERVRGIEEAAERESESRLVRGLIDAGNAGGLAVLGWEATLQALLEGRVHKLLLAEGSARQGRICPAGHVVLLETPPNCPFCGGALDLVEDLAEWARERALDTDAGLEDVRGTAAEDLNAQADGIGAVLRY